MPASRTIHRTTLGMLSAALALVATACPIDPPAPISPYHPGGLAPGNVVYVDVGSSDSRILSNPGGVSDFPIDPALSELRFDLAGYGNPTTTARLGALAPNHLGMYDAAGNLQRDLGAGAVTWMFSADGSTFAIAHQTGPTAPDLVVYDTSDMSVRRSFPWTTAGQLPIVVDLDRDGSRVLVRGLNPGFPGADLGVLTATTGGTDPLVPAILPGSGFAVAPRLTGADRVTSFRGPVGATSGTYELRSNALDGTDVRNLGTFTIDTSVSGVPAAAAEAGTGRIIIQANLPGSSPVQSQIITIDDSAAATRTVIAGPLPQLAGLQRLVGEAS